MHRVPAQSMLVVLLGTVYCNLAPLILPICALFFGLSYLFWKHNMVYVNHELLDCLVMLIIVAMQILFQDVLLYEVHQIETLVIE